MLVHIPDRGGTGGAPPSPSRVDILAKIGTLFTRRREEGGQSCARTPLSGIGAMPISYLSSVVFVGGQFAASMFDEREFCNGFGPLEGEQIKAGPVGHFRYSRGQYGFQVAPDRVDIQCRKAAILPEELITAAEKVIARLEPARSAIPVSGLGLNCDVVFGAREIHQDGRTWCSALTDTPHTQKVFARPVTSFVTCSFQSGGVRYAVRLEPEARSQGENLFVSVNGHQDLTPTDPLRERLGMVGEVRSQITELHHRLLSS